MSNFLNLHARFSGGANSVNSFLGMLNLSPNTGRGDVRNVTPSNTTDNLLSAAVRNLKSVSDRLDIHSVAVKLSHLNNLSVGQLGEFVFRSSRSIGRDCRRMLFALGLPSFGNHVSGIVGACSNEKMSRVAARGVVASVADTSLRKRAVMVKVSQSMSRHSLVVQACRAISVFVHASSPRPASIWTGRLINFLPERIWGLFWSSHNSIKTPITPEVNPARIGGIGNDRRKFWEHSFFAADSMPFQTLTNRLNYGN